MAMVSALLLLLVLTMLSVGMFHSFGLEERMAGNTREKQRATHAAGATLTYGESWMISNGGSNAMDAGTGTACAGITATPVVCSNIITNVTQVPWATATNHSPPSMNVTTGTAGAQGAYIAQPQLYISYLSGYYNATAGTQTNAYQIDATAYGGNYNSATVVESTYLVSVTYTSRSDRSKYINLGGP